MPQEKTNMKLYIALLWYDVSYGILVTYFSPNECRMPFCSPPGLVPCPSSSSAASSRVPSSSTAIVVHRHRRPLPHTRHLRLFLAVAFLAPFAFAVAFSSPDLWRSPFFGRPDLFAAVQSGHKRKRWSGILPYLMVLMVSFSSAYMSKGNCTRHCDLFHQTGMIFIGVICGRMMELSPIAAMCSQGTPSIWSAPQVHAPKYDPFTGSLGRRTICSCAPVTCCDEP